MIPLIYKKYESHKNFLSSVKLSICFSLLIVKKKTLEF